MQERVNALNTEREAINASIAKFDKRKASYDTKCQGKSFDLDNKDQERIANECEKESEWLISNQKSLKERQKKYKENFTKLKLDMEALKKAPVKTQGKK
jgi:hypothetical protein